MCNTVSKKMCNVSKKDYKFVAAAMEECKNSTMMMKHGCVVADGSKMLATGHNHYRTRFSDKFIRESCSCHAEMDALRKVSKVTSQQSKSYKVRKRVGQRYEKVV